ncbi:MAG: glycosyltransferase [Clostridia bacterium]
MSRATEQKPVRVLYVSMQMKEETCKRLFADAPVPPSQAAQKYNRLMAQGLAKAGAEVIAITPPPVSRQTCKRRFVSLGQERADGVNYRYLPIVNLPLIKAAVVVITSFFTTLSALHQNAYVLCDGLAIAASCGARIAAKLRHRPCTVIVTDIPDQLTGGSTCVSSFNMRELTRYDGYLLLTETMNALVNPHGRPKIVAEGLVDASLHSRHNILAQKHAEKVCLYAGMLHEKYGILRLVQAFSTLADQQARLVIYGTGDSVTAIAAAAKADPRIEYRGVAENAIVVHEEFAATLLINPRPTHEAFASDSFPSKNLEYMASGTPVLTTRLPGMPQAYEEFVYLMDDETPEGMAQTLRTVLALPRETLHEKGLSAKAFVLTYKNNILQAGRVLTFMEGLDPWKTC